MIVITVDTEFGEEGGRYLVLSVGPVRFYPIYIPITHSPAEVEAMKLREVAKLHSQLKDLVEKYK